MREYLPRAGDAGTRATRWADLGDDVMTEQIPEILILDGRPYDVCGIRGGDRLFDLRDHGITPIALTSECCRGFISTYLVADGILYLDEIEVGLDPREPTGRDHVLLSTLLGDSRLNGSSTPGHYENLEYPIAFTGGLLLGHGLIKEPYVCMGFHPAYTYREIVELGLDEGRVVTRVDRSAELDQLRKKIVCGDRNGAGPLPDWIERGFDFEYS